MKDQEEALEFYTNVLGFEKRTDFTSSWGSRYVTVAPKGQDIEISLFKAGTYPGQNGGGITWEAGKGGGVLRTSDCKRDFEELKARGARFDESKPGEAAWGVYATLIDPDGNRFTLLQSAANQA